MNEKTTRPEPVKAAVKELQEIANLKEEAINPLDTIIRYVIELESKCEKLESDLKTSREVCEYYRKDEERANATTDTLRKIISGINGMTDLAKEL